jgi:hypothetical protein
MTQEKTMNENAGECKNANALADESQRLEIKFVNFSSVM